MTWILTLSAQCDALYVTPPLGPLHYVMYGCVTRKKTLEKIMKYEVTYK